MAAIPVPGFLASFSCDIYERLGCFSSYDLLSPACSSTSSIYYCVRREIDLVGVTSDLVASIVAINSKSIVSVS